MKWSIPDNPISHEEEAIKWWLDRHFLPCDQREAAWAIDLYASYLDAAIETKGLPVVTIAMFGRVVATLVPRSSYITRGKDADTDRRSGRRYLVKPLSHVTMVTVGKVENGAATCRTLYNDAYKASGNRQTSDWLQWNEQLAADKGSLSDWLITQRLEPAGETPTPHAPSVTSLFRRFNESMSPYGWKESRFRRALAEITRIKRGDGGARHVAELKEVA